MAEQMLQLLPSWWTKFAWTTDIWKQIVRKLCPLVESSPDEQRSTLFLRESPKQSLAWIFLSPTKSTSK